MKLMRPFKTFKKPGWWIGGIFYIAAGYLIFKWFDLHLFIVLALLALAHNAERHTDD